MVDIGKLDKRIKVYKRIDVSDEETGTDEKKDVFMRKIWASIQPRTGSLLTGREAETMLSKTTHAVICRSLSAKGMTNDCYIEWVDEFGNRHIFDIDYILPPAGANQTVIYCTEVI